ncbi:MAG: glycosyltransferase, partial [Thermodesulfovibrionales bacterium]
MSNASLEKEAMIVVVLPAYNEALCIGDLLNSFCEAIADKGKAWRLIVVDDGSTDGTRDVVSSFANRIDLKLISHPRNMG